MLDLGRELKEGVRLPKPYCCPTQIDKIISQCFMANPSDRPSFDDIKCDIELAYKQLNEETKEYENTSREELHYADLQFEQVYFDMKRRIYHFQEEPSIDSQENDYLSQERVQYSDLPNDEVGESPALEVMKYQVTQQFFGQSTIVRYLKAPHIQFRVGQVVKHKKWGYRGVITAWDETAKAPEKWLKVMHKENKELQNQPNYSILVDTRDRQAPRK